MIVSLFHLFNKEIAESSIYKYLEKELGLNITHSRREISFRYATEEEKQHMDLGEYNMVAVVESITYLSNGNILQYGILTYRPDKVHICNYGKKIKTTRKLRFY